MLRKDRERDAAFAWEVFQKAPYATLSLTDEVGKPYAIPISPVVDEAYHVVYFHCAGHGEKWELLAKNPPVCLSAVSYAAAIPNEFSMAYASAALHGRAEVVTDEAEQVKAMLLLCTAYDPKGMGRFSEYMEKYMSATRVVRIVPETVTGKLRCPGEGAPRLRRPSLKEGGWKADDRGNSCRRKKCGKVRQLRKGSCCPSR